MGKDLTSMIEEINTASASINKSAKSDDPVSPRVYQMLSLHTLIFYSYHKLSAFSTATSHNYRSSIKAQRSCKGRLQRHNDKARGSDQEVEAG